MSYQVEEINVLEQFGERMSTFILTDDEKIMPEIRLEKFFKINKNMEKRIELAKVNDCAFYEMVYWDSLGE